MSDDYYDLIGVLCSTIVTVEKGSILHASRTYAKNSRCIYSYIANCSPITNASDIYIYIISQEMCNGFYITIIYNNSIAIVKVVFIYLLNIWLAFKLLFFLFSSSHLLFLIFTENHDLEQSFHINTLQGGYSLYNFMFRWYFRKQNFSLTWHNNDDSWAIWLDAVYL